MAARWKRGWSAFPNAQRAIYEPVFRAFINVRHALLEMNWSSFYQGRGWICLFLSWLPMYTEKRFPCILTEVVQLVFTTTKILWCNSTCGKNTQLFLKNTEIECFYTQMTLVYFLKTFYTLLESIITPKFSWVYFRTKLQSFITLNSVDCILALEWTPHHTQLIWGLN